MTWPTVKLGECVTKAATWNPLNSDVEEFTYVDLSAVDQVKKEIIKEHKINSCEAPSRARQIIEVNDVLVSTVRPNLNGVCKVSSRFHLATASTGFCVLRAKDNILNHSYLFNWVKNINFVNDMVNKATGASYPAVSDRIIYDSLIPLPPLTEQQRIATILDKAEEIRRKREQSIAKLDQLAQSTFIEMFGEHFSGSNKTVNDFFEVNVNRYATNLKDSDSVSFIPMSAVSEISKTIKHEETRAYSEVKKGYTPIKSGDLIVAKITPCYENGKQAIATVSTKFAYGSTEFHTFRSCNKELVTLLHYYLQTKKVMREGAANMKGAAGQKRVPDAYFKSLPFSLPSKREVDKFTAFIACKNEHRAEQSRQLVVIEKNIQSLQHQAFSTGFRA